MRALIMPSRCTWLPFGNKPLALQKVFARVTRTDKKESPFTKKSILKLGTTREKVAGIESETFFRKKASAISSYKYDFFRTILSLILLL